MLTNITTEVTILQTLPSQTLSAGYIRWQWFWSEKFWPAHL